MTGCNHQFCKEKEAIVVWPGVLCVFWQQHKASVNVPRNQPHMVSYDNTAYVAGSDIASACHPPLLYEGFMTSNQTFMAGKGQEVDPKLDGPILSRMISILLASTPAMLPRWSLTDSGGRPSLINGLSMLESEQGSQVSYLSRHQNICKELLKASSTQFMAKACV